jgi:hypothetical protein
MIPPDPIIPRTGDLAVALDPFGDVPERVHGGGHPYRDRPRQLHPRGDDQPAVGGRDACAITAVAAVDVDGGEPQSAVAAVNVTRRAGFRRGGDAQSRLGGEWIRRVLERGASKMIFCSIALARSSPWRPTRVMAKCLVSSPITAMAVLGSAMASSTPAWTRSGAPSRAGERQRGAQGLGGRGNWGVEQAVIGHRS